MSVDVDKAWNKLYTKLKDENLLVSGNEKATVIPFFVKMRRIAAVIAICICSGAIALYLSSGKEKNPFVSIYNDEITNTLVSTLEDGSIVYLSGGGALTCPEPFTTGKRKVALRGEALFDVNSDRTRPFFIETEPALVEVTGTQFNLKSVGKESFELSVLQGSVKVTLKTSGTPVQVDNGETVRLQSGRLQKALSTDARQFAHYTKKMQFKDERLENIVRVIHKISGKSVIFSDPDLKDMEITITFNNNTVDEMIELLCTGFDLKYTDDGKEVVIGR